MDFIEPIVSVASKIYEMVENVKSNHQRCRRVAERVRGLEGLVISLKNSGAITKTPVLKDAIRDLSTTLRSAQKLIQTYTKKDWIDRFLKSGKYEDEFGSVNDRLDDAFQVLSGAQVVGLGEGLKELFEKSTREAQDRADEKEDEAELRRLLLEHMRSMEENMEKILNILSDRGGTHVDIRNIKFEELKFIPDLPRKPIRKTETSELFQGEYKGISVAIKRYINPNANPKKVESIFNQEAQNMKQFESPHILRMYGICIENENSPNPSFFLIHEYCDNGNLRDFLSSDISLSWAMKARMCLDAAKGLYRLHQTEEKSKVHGSISCCKFLVTEDHRIKLSGFELTKTETSIRNATTKAKETSSLCYVSPEQLNDLNYNYNKKCEIYSLGIVMWEIATRKKPFDGCKDEEIYAKVCEQKFLEPCPPECPESLAELIDACRAYDGFQRPTSGVLVDKLRMVVVQLEKL
ncbi:mixed lineage kinase domain-like protein [Menidia menidia]